ncbi:hypothetical protein BpHYR1_037992 [Brachionus plicatilis]|uniref:Uncharacterized protein n=1 Tax=Brachionus plicatilis TaxID=10195 RepID=A0A3M7Q0I1_BRAPC|nr:hypothetical protein BpHYR1_037992 [Brachionus plicatilis]
MFSSNSDLDEDDSNIIGLVFRFLKVGSDFEKNSKAYLIIKNSLPAVKQQTSTFGGLVAATHGIKH